MITRQGLANFLICSLKLTNLSIDSCQAALYVLFFNDKLDTKLANAIIC